MDDFNFYNSENDGYRGGFGDYSDPIPTSGGPVQPGQAPNKKGGSGKRIDVSAAREGNSFVIRVRDYGPGIPEAELPFVKQKFYKGSSKARGSGIGLAVCDEIVRLHGGTFDIANADGGGAVVTIALPIP